MGRADVVRVTYQADIKDLKAKLASIPDITGAEARKMVAALDRSIKQVERTQQRVTQSTKGFTAGVLDSVGALRMQALAAGAAAVGVYALFQAQADMVNQLADLARKTGQSAEDLQAWDLAARSSGQSLGELQTAFTALPKRLADVARGTGEAKKALDHLGISATNADGSLRDAGDVTREFFELTRDGYTDTERAALATQVFGEAGTRLVQALSGRELSEFVGLSSEFGAKIGPDAAAAAAEWQAQTALLQTAFAGMTQELLGVGVSGAEILNRFGQVAVFTFTYIDHQVRSFIAAAKEYGSAMRDLFSSDMLTDPVAALRRTLTGFADLATTPFQVGEALAVASERAHAYAQTMGLASAVTTDLGDAADDARDPVGKLGAAVDSLDKAIQDALAKSATEYGAAMADLQRQATAAADALMDSEEKIVTLRDRQIAQLRELAAITGDEATAEQAILDVQTAAASELSDLYETQRQDQADRHAARMAEIEQERAAVVASVQAQVTLTAAMLGSVSDLFSDLAQDQTAYSGAAFAAAKVAAIAQAEILAIQALLQGLASAPPPFGAALAAVQFGLAQAQIARLHAVEPPAAYTGATVREISASTTGTPITAHPGETVVDRQTSREMRQGSSQPPAWMIRLDGREMARGVARQASSSRSLSSQLGARPGLVGRRTYGD